MSHFISIIEYIFLVAGNRCSERTKLLSEVFFLRENFCFPRSNFSFLRSALGFDSPDKKKEQFDQGKQKFSQRKEELRALFLKIATFFGY